MAWSITGDDSLMTVALDGRFVAAVAPSLREEVLGKMKPGVFTLPYPWSIATRMGFLFSSVICTSFCRCLRRIE